MKSFIKDACIIFSIIFTVLILIHFFRGEELSRKILSLFIFISFFSSAMSFLLVDHDKYSNRRIVIQQLLYLGIIMAAVILISSFAGLEQSPSTVLINLIVVIGIYIFIKYLLLTEDKKDAAEINKALNSKKKADK